MEPAWAEVWTRSFPEDPSTISDYAILWFWDSKTHVFIPITMGYLFGADPCLAWSLPNTCSQVCAGGFAGVCAVAWQKLSSQDGPLLAFPTFFKDAHKCSNHFLIRRWNSYFLCWSSGNVLVHTDKFPISTHSTGVTIYNTQPICNLYPAVTFFKGLCRNGPYANALHRGKSFQFSFSSLSLFWKSSVQWLPEKSLCFWAICTVWYGLLTDTNFS